MPRQPLRGARKIFQERELSDGDGKKAGLALSWPILGAAAIFLAGAIAWAFFMGFMVGQGHNPNAKIQEITGISLPISKAEEERTEPEETAAAPPAPANPAAESVSPQEKPEPAFRVPKGQELKAWGEAPQKPAAPPPVKKDKPARAEKEPLFDFSFQIAAFKNSADAENLQKKLKAAAIKTKIQKSGKVSLLIADIRGPASAPESLRQKLTPFKLGKPLQLSKKPIPVKTKRNK